MPKRLIDLTEADALNNGEDLLYIRQASGSRRDRKITTLELLKGMFSSLGGVTDSWTAATMGAAKILAQRTVLGAVEHAWIDLPALFTDKLAPLVSGLAGEAGAREDADTALGNQLTTETNQRIAGDTTLTTALANQQLYVRTFSDLTQFFPGAVATNQTAIKAQNRIVHHRNSAGKTVFAELFFHWSATSADSGSCGWTIPSYSGALAPEIDSALRELWGIAYDAEWPFPFLHGVLYTVSHAYPVSLYHQPGTGGSGVFYYSIAGWDQSANVLSFGDLRVLVPGEVSLT